MSAHRRIQILAEERNTTELDLLLDTLNKTESPSETARQLGVTYPTIWKLMKEHDIQKRVKFFLSESIQA